MLDKFFCTYKTNSPVVFEEKDQDKIKIVQLFVENGLMKISDKSYPIVYGDVFFIDAGQEYSIEELDEEVIQSSVMIDAVYLEEIAELLNFKKEYHQILKKYGSTHVAAPHYKAIDQRFKEAFSVYTAEKPFAQALLIARIIELFNYAVVTINKRK